MYFCCTYSLLDISFFVVVVLGKRGIEQIYWSNFPVCILSPRSFAMSGIQKTILMSFMLTGTLPPSSQSKLKFTIIFILKPLLPCCCPGYGACFLFNIAGRKPTTMKNVLKKQWIGLLLETIKALAVDAELIIIHNTSTPIQLISVFQD